MKLIFNNDQRKLFFLLFLVVLLSNKINAQTWNLNYSTATTSEQIVVMSSPNDSICWFITNFDKLYKTNDGGTTWTQIPPGTVSFNPSGLYVVDENIAFKSGTQQIFRTANGGLTWSLVFTGSQFSPPVVQMKDSDTGVVASGGVLSKTTNGGVSWSSSVITQPPLNIQNTSGKGNVFNLGNELWVTQQNGGVAYSPDFGNSWSTPLNIGLSSVTSDARISFANTNFGIALQGGVWPYVFVTSDGGNNWTNTDNSLGANEDVVADSTELWYIPNPADHFYIKHSIDSGATWQIQLQLSGVHGFNVLEKSRTGHVLWAGTNQGKLYKYQLLPTIMEEKSNKSETIVFPNPASDKIYFNSNNLKNVAIFNTLGIYVASKEIINSYEAYIDISNLSDGLYFIKITSTKNEQKIIKLIKQN